MATSDTVGAVGGLDNWAKVVVAAVATVTWEVARSSTRCSYDNVGTRRTLSAMFLCEKRTIPCTHAAWVRVGQPSVCPSSLAHSLTQLICNKETQSLTTRAGALGAGCCCASASRVGLPVLFALRGAVQ